MNSYGLRRVRFLHARETVQMSEVSGKDSQVAAPASLKKFRNFESLTAQIKSQVNESAVTLLGRNFTFTDILKHSGVNEAFLESVFRDLGLQCNHVDKVASENTNHPALKESHNSCDEDSILLPEPSCGKNQNNNETFFEDTSKQASRRNIEFEMRLFSLRMHMEINKVSSLIEDKFVQEQLEDTELRHNILCKKDLLINELERLFGKLKENPGKKTSHQKRTHSDIANDDSPVNVKRSKEIGSTGRDHVNDSSPESFDQEGPLRSPQVCIALFPKYKKGNPTNPLAPSNPTLCHSRSWIFG